MHNDTWQLQEAKAKLSAVIRAAREAPQFITVRGTEEFVLMPVEQYEKMERKKSKPRKTETVGEFFRRSPLFGIGDALDISRPRAKYRRRDIDFDDGSFG